MRKYPSTIFWSSSAVHYFRQTIFAEFEKITHAMAEKGEPLTWKA